MKVTDNLNFRGKYKQYDPDGKAYLYRIGDSVEYKGELFTAVKSNSFKIPGTLQGNAYWRSLGSSDGFYISEYEEIPANPDIGDRWYVPSTGIMYTYIQEESNKFWVEL
jgi:hypothetical protein